MIFISHRKIDEDKAKAIQQYISRDGVESYLDVLDPEIKTATDITKHIISQLRKCSHLIAIFTNNTKGSLWVPFELGAAYEGKKGIGTYIHGLSDYELPDYLEAFPIMKSSSGLDKYLEVYKTDRRYQKLFESERTAAYEGPDEFIKNLKARLGQK